MNKVIIWGKVTKNAEKVQIATSQEQTSFVSFNVVDLGKPYQNQNTENLEIEVNFQKEAAFHIYEFLVKDKEVYIDGCLRMKTVKNQRGQSWKKYYVAADYVGLIPLEKK